MRYAETDQMGVVYYANYLVWMEVGRVEYCKAFGFNYRIMEIEDGVMLAVAEARCRYSFPARFDDRVLIKTWISEASSRMVTFAYEMRLAADGRKAGGRRDPPHFLQSRIEAVPDAVEVSREVRPYASRRRTRAGSVNSAQISSSTPPTAIPTIRNGSRISHTIG